MLSNRMADLAQRAWSESRYVYTDFLTLAEQSDLLASERSLAVPFRLCGGYAEAERRMACFGSSEELGYEESFPIRILKIYPLSYKFGETLGHRDYLGALLNLGIDRRVLGDIRIAGKNAYVFCTDSIADFLTESVCRIRHTSVEAILVSEVPQEAFVQPAQAALIVPSPRLDAVLARVFHLSRGQAQKLVSAQRVFVNSRLALNTSYLLKEKDLVSVRGYGRFRYLTTENETRKGNQKIVLEIYSKI